MSTKNIISLLLLVLVLGSCTIFKKKPAPKGRRPSKAISTVPVPSYTTHKVIKGETLESVSKIYGVTPEEILKTNPGLERKLLPSQLIKIPPANKTFPTKDIVPISSVNIALLLPFNIQSNIETEVDLDEDEKAQSKEDKSKQTLIPVEFYQGVLVALDTLKKQNFNAKVFVFDAESDSNAVKKLIAQPDFKLMNLIVGPFSSSHLIPAARFAQQNKIPLVSPLSSAAPPFLNNDQVILATPTVQTQSALMADFLAENYKRDNYLIIHQGEKKEVEVAEVFKRGLKFKANITPKELVYKKTEAKEIANSLIPGQRNVVIIPSGNEAFVSELFLYLHSRKEKFNLTVIGLPTWENFETIDIDMFQNLNTHIFKSFHVDPSSNWYKEFRKQYINRFKTDPSIYAFQGYDVMYTIGSTVKEKGLNITQNLSSSKYSSLHTDYIFKKNNAGLLENQAISVLKFEGYKLQKINK